jgi:uncharacterized protein YkwD
VNPPQYSQTSNQVQIPQTSSDSRIIPASYTTPENKSTSTTTTEAATIEATKKEEAKREAAKRVTAIALSLALNGARTEPEPAVAASDPYGFTDWLNATRASYGLPAVGHDPNLSNWAAVNNSHQASRGLGHFVMGPARRQNAAVGSISNIGSMWMNSPAHRAALLDPTIRWIGIAGLGAYWTFNAN